MNTRHTLRLKFLSLAAVLVAALSWGAASSHAAVAYMKGSGVYVAANDGSGARMIGTIKPGDYVPRLVRVAPDGLHVATSTRYGKSGSRVVILSATGEAPRVLSFKKPLSYSWLNATTLAVSTTERRSNDIYSVSIAPGAGQPSRIARFAFRPCGKNDEPGEEGFSCGARLTDITASPDGSRIAVTGPTGGIALRVITSAGRKIFTQGGRGGNLYQIVGAAFSPEGSNTLLTSELPNTSSNWIVSSISATGKRTVAFRTKGLDPSVGGSVAWSTDGAIGAFISYRNIMSDDPRLQLLNRTTGKVTALGSARRSSEVEYVAGFSDATHALVVGSTGRVSVVDTTTGTFTSLFATRVASLDIRGV